MKKMMMFAVCAAMTGMVAGCFTSATAYTEKTNPDGTKTVSRVSVIGTGDKGSKKESDWKTSKEFPLMFGNNRLGRKPKDNKK